MIEFNDKEHRLLIMALNCATDQLDLKEYAELLKRKNQIALLELKAKLLDVEVTQDRVE